MRSFCLILAVTSFSLPLCADNASTLKVDFSNPRLQPSHWTLTIRPDGSGHFHSERATPPASSDKTFGDPPAVDTPGMDRDIQLSAEFTERVFQTARGQKFHRGECESHMKVAFQGWKKLTYRGPEGQSVCEFNYAKDKEIQNLGDSLVSVASTIMEGAKLESLLQYDRLGLDRETEYLVEAAGDGHVQQVCAIRGILERLAEDQGVLERVRKRARQLLARADK
jgi:hypothetical protein